MLIVEQSGSQFWVSDKEGRRSHFEVTEVKLSYNEVSLWGHVNSSLFRTLCESDRSIWLVCIYGEFCTITKLFDEKSSNYKSVVSKKYYPVDHLSSLLRYSSCSLFLCREKIRILDSFMYNCTMYMCLDYLIVSSATLFLELFSDCPGCSVKFH